MTLGNHDRESVLCIKHNPSRHVNQSWTTLEKKTKIIFNTLQILCYFRAEVEVVSNIGAPARILHEAPSWISGRDRRKNLCMGENFRKNYPRTFPFKKTVKVLHLPATLKVM